MPRVKIAYVVSFSSEDPEHRAANLLAAEVSKKRWLCSKWEPSCSVVLQLERAVEISAVHIGAYHAALIEVLVGLSERPNDPFQVLVPRCVLQSAAEARAAAPDRVRSFPAPALAADTRRRRFDRVRVVCSQPYNKHCKAERGTVYTWAKSQGGPCPLAVGEGPFPPRLHTPLVIYTHRCVPTQYGLSFIHIYEPERREPGPAVSAPAAPAPAPAALPTRLFNVDAVSSDEDEFRPGELFAKHLKSPSTTDNTTNTSAQIRQATSQALKNMPYSSTKLLKTPINTSSTNRPKNNDDVQTDRQRSSLIYTDDDDKPHDKIDRVVNRHKDERSKDQDLSKTKNMDKKNGKEKIDESSSHSKKHTGEGETIKRSKDTPPEATTPHSDIHRQRDGERTPRQHEAQKRPRDSEKIVDNSGSLSAGPVCSELSQVLRGVTLALSGYAGQRRAALRDAALLLGARYSAHWTPRCTHLVCAFPNTPKLRAVRAEGTRAGVATAEWVETCLARRRRLPWQWFATLPAECIPEPPPSPPSLPSLPSLPSPPTPEKKQRNSKPAQTFNEDEDTDDEIEKAMSVKKKPRLSSPDPSPPRPANVSSDSDVTFVRDERFRGHVTLDSDDDGDATDQGDHATKEERIDTSKALPDFFEGYTFVISDELREQSQLLARYVGAYGGLVIQEADVQEDSEVHYVLSRRGGGAGAAGAGAGVCVAPRWLWRCHRERRRCALH